MIDFFVAGVPQSQGSARAFVRGNRAVVTSANKTLKPWRDAVNSAFMRECSSLLEVPIKVDLEFVMPRTKSLPKTKVRPHATKPDLDKLIRAVLDAGTGIAWADDSCINRINARKRYAGIGEQPGVHVFAITDPRPVPSPDEHHFVVIRTGLP